MVRSASSRVSNHLAHCLTPSFETPREAPPDDRLREAIQLANNKKAGLLVASLLAMTDDLTTYTATSMATPITISAMPDSSRADSGCLNE